VDEHIRVNGGLNDYKDPTSLFSNQVAKIKFNITKAMDDFVETSG